MSLSQRQRGHESSPFHRNERCTAKKYRVSRNVLYLLSVCLKNNSRLIQAHTHAPLPSFLLQRAQCSHCKRCISYSNSVRLSVRPSVCLSVRLSVTRRYCVKTRARSTMQFAPLDSKMCPKNIPQGRPRPPEILPPSDLPPPDSSES